MQSLLLYLLIVGGSIPLPVDYFEVSFYLLGVIAGMFLLMLGGVSLYLGRVPKSSGVASIFALLCVYGLNGLLQNGDLDRIIKEFFVFAFPFLIYVFLKTMVAPRSAGTRYLYQMVARSIILLVIAQFVLSAIGAFDYQSRFQYRHEYVLLSTPVIALFPLAVDGISRTSRKRMFVFLCALCLCLTLSRESMVFVILLSVGYATRSLFPLLQRLFLLSLCLFPFLYFVLLGMGVIDAGDDLSADWRIIEVLTVLSNLDLTTVQGWLGSGFGSYTYIPKGIPINGVLVTELPRFHNIWLYMIFKFGLIGAFILWASAIWVIFRTHLENQKEYYVAFLYAYTFCVSGSFWGLFSTSAASSIALAIILWARESVRFEGHRRVHGGFGDVLVGASGSSAPAVAGVSQA